MTLRFTVAVVLICLTGSGLASELFGVNFPAATPLFSLNQSSGRLTSIGPTSFADVADLTSDPQTGALWGVDSDTNELLTINPHTGATSVAAQLDSPSPIVSIAFDPVTHRLYGNTALIFGTTNWDALYAIDPTSGSTTLKGPIGFAGVFALGFDQDGRLFGISDFTKQLLSIDPATGAGVAMFRLNLNAAYDLASRPEDNALLVADSTTNSLYTLNTADGRTSMIGGYGPTTNIVGLAFLMPSPEPITYFSLGLGLALLARVWQRRRSPRNHCVRLTAIP